MYQWCVSQLILIYQFSFSLTAAFSAPDQFRMCKGSCGRALPIQSSAHLESEKLRPAVVMAVQRCAPVDVVGCGADGVLDALVAARGLLAPPILPGRLRPGATPRPL